MKNGTAHRPFPTYSIQSFLERINSATGESSAIKEYVPTCQCWCWFSPERARETSKSAKSIREAGPPEMDT